MAKLELISAGADKIWDCRDLQSYLDALHLVFHALGLLSQFFYLITKAEMGMRKPAGEGIYVACSIHFLGDA